jgi:hypothetical protein
LGFVLRAVFVSVPQVIGRAITDLFGRDKAAVSTTVILGYAVVAVAALFLWGFIDLSKTLELFKSTWRFFFPVK